MCLWKGCFTGDTLVLMADGSAKPISEIQYGDLVLTKSDTTSIVQAKAVTQVFSHEEPSTLRLTFGDGSAIRTTPEHPFWVEGGGWTPASRLALGNAIVTRAGPRTPEKSAAIASVKTVRGGVRVYNFSVEDSHTYFVQDADGRGDFKWVHNTCTTVNQALRAFNAGKTEIEVASRQVAEETALALKTEFNLANSTGLSEQTASNWFRESVSAKGLGGHYHWDDIFGADGLLLGHGPTNPHALIPHLQVEVWGKAIARFMFQR